MKTGLMLCNSLLLLVSMSATAGSDVVATCNGKAGNTKWQLEISKNEVTKQLRAKLSSSEHTQAEPYLFDVNLNVPSGRAREFARSYEGQGFDLVIGLDKGKSALKAALDHGRPFSDDGSSEDSVNMICSY